MKITELHQLAQLPIVDPDKLPPRTRIIGRVSGDGVVEITDPTWRPIPKGPEAEGDDDGRAQS